MILKNITIFLFPLSFCRMFFRNRDRICNSARIGFSWVNVENLTMHNGARIGNFNFIDCDRLELHKESQIHSLNVIKGPISIIISCKAQIGKRNIVTRSAMGVVWGDSYLKIGYNSKITAGHKLDLTQSISIGRNSIIAGLGSQLWTHGYVHKRNGERYRVDGSIDIGENVYIGSSVIINSNVKISNNITVGSGSSVSKNLTLSGMYVSMPLRYIEKDNYSVSDNLLLVDDPNLCEKVYVKK